MILRLKTTQDLIEVLDLVELTNPFQTALLGRLLAGEEAQEPEKFGKADLCFPSGENLPRSWVDPHYRDDEIYEHMNQGDA